GGDVGGLVLAALVRAQDRALEAGKGEVRLGAAEQRAGQRDRFRVPLGREALDRWAARKAQAEDLGGVVEGRAQRVVDSRSEAAVLTDAAYFEQLAVPARHEQQRVRKPKVGIGEARAQRMTFEVINRQQRLV